MDFTGVFYCTTDKQTATRQHTCFLVPVAPLITQKNSQKQVNLLWELYLRYLSPLNRDYSMMLLTTPEPTVRPPSRVLTLAFRLVFGVFSGFLYIKVGAFIHIIYIIQKFYLTRAPIA